MFKNKIIGTILVIFFMGVLSVFAQPKYTEVSVVFDKDIEMSSLSSAFTFAASGETCYASSTASNATESYYTAVVPLDADTITFILEISNADSMYATNGVDAAFDVTLLPTSPNGWFMSDTTTHLSGINVFSSSVYTGAYTKNVKVFYSANIKPSSPGYIYGKLSIWIGSKYQTTNGFHVTIYQVRKWRNTY